MWSSSTEVSGRTELEDVCRSYPVLHRFGAPAVGLAATGAVLLGQLIVVWAQRGGTEVGQAVHGMVSDRGTV
jgi:hypothetical protein